MAKKSYTPTQHQPPENLYKYSDLETRVLLCAYLLVKMRKSLILDSDTY